MGQTIGCIIEDGGLLYLEEEESTCLTTENQDPVVLEVMKLHRVSLFHYQFGHPSFDLLKQWFPFFW